MNKKATLEELRKKGFELINKFSKQSKIPKRHISITPHGRVTFSSDLIKIINEKFDGFEVLVNAQEKKIIFYPSTNQTNCFKLSRNSFFSKALIRDLNIETAYYPARYNLGVIEIDFRIIKNQRGVRKE